MISSGAHSARVLLREGISISQLGLGTATLGGLYSSVSESDGVAVIRAALDAGINYFDTAPHYGKGASETRLKRYLRDVPRSQYVLSTKVGRLLLPSEKSVDPDFADADPSVTRVFDFSADGVRRSLDESLKRLGEDFVDIVFIHDPDDFADQAIREAYPALEELRDQGVIKAIGVGMNQSAIPTRFVNETDIDLVLIAGRYTLLDSSAEEDLLPAALERSVSVIAGGVFNSGILANPVSGATYEYAPASEEILARARAIEDLLREFDVSLSQAALQFPFQHPSVKSVLVGCRTSAEVNQNISAFDGAVPQEAWDALDALRSKIA